MIKAEPPDRHFIHCLLFHDWALVSRPAAEKGSMQKYQQYCFNNENGRYHV